MRMREKITSLIVATMFCLLRPIAAQALDSEQFQLAVLFFDIFTKHIRNKALTLSLTNINAKLYSENDKSFWEFVRFLASCFSANLIVNLLNKYLTYTALQNKYSPTYITDLHSTTNIWSILIKQPFVWWGFIESW